MSHLPERFYRDVWLVAVTVMVLLGLLALNNQNSKIQEGRQATTEITCAASAAVVKGGKLTIITASQSPLPRRLEAFLHRYGYPGKQARQAQARKAGDAYTHFINREIIAAAGVRAATVLEPDHLPNGKRNPDAGALNCKRLRAVAHLK